MIERPTDLAHGVAGPMLMATARGILLSRCGEPGSLGALLTHVNELLVDDTGGERFMTMLLMTIDPTRGEMRWASAGHGAPFVYDPRNDDFIELGAGGLPLGVLGGETYDEHAFADVREGQLCLAATDGVWEACNEEGSTFGKERVCSLLRQHAQLSAAEISDRLRAELTRFRGAASQEDDITFVVVKVQSPTPGGPGAYTRSRGPLA